MKLRLASQLNARDKKQKKLQESLRADAKLGFIYERHYWDVSTVHFEKSIDEATFVKQQSKNAASVIMLFMGGTNVAFGGQAITAGGCVQSGIEAASGERGIADAAFGCGLDIASLGLGNAISNSSKSEVVKAIIGAVKETGVTTLKVVSSHFDGTDKDDELLTTSEDLRWHLINALREGGLPRSK